MYAPRESPARPVAEAVTWLWRLGPVLDEPAPNAVGFGSEAEGAALRELVGRGDLAGAVVFATGRAATGVARFAAGERVRGSFALLDSGTPVVESSLGVHAAREGDLLSLGADPEAWWQRLEYHWVLEALEPFLAERLERPVVKLPPVGVVRLDDAPGTAQLQMQGRSHADSRQNGRLRSLRLAFGKAGACLNTAVVAEALEERRRVPLDEVWPESVSQLRSGVADGAFEPVCHGLLHLVPEKMERGEVDWMEFRELDREEASRRLGIALDWQERALGRRPATFVAPAWGYSEGALQAATDHGLQPGCRRSPVRCSTALICARPSTPPWRASTSSTTPRWRAGRPRAGPPRWCSTEGCSTSGWSCCAPRTTTRPLRGSSSGATCSASRASMG